jgi:hypothetical protein
MVLYLCALIVFSLRRESLKLILAMNPSPRWFCHRVSDIQGTLTTTIIVEYIDLWDLLEEVQLQQEVDDTHIWRLDASTQYSARSVCD